MDSSSKLMLRKYANAREEGFLAHSGGCLCGKARYQIGAEPITARMCWCRDCQKIGAGGPTVNAVFPSSALKVTGELRDYPSTTAPRITSDSADEPFSGAVGLNATPVASKRRGQVRELS